MVDMKTAASFDMVLPTYQIARRQSKYNVTLAAKFSMVLTRAQYWTFFWASLSIFSHRVSIKSIFYCHPNVCTYTCQIFSCQVFGHALCRAPHLLVFDSVTVLIFLAKIKPNEISVRVAVSSLTPPTFSCHYLRHRSKLSSQQSVLKLPQTTVFFP